MKLLKILFSVTIITIVINTFWLVACHTDTISNQNIPDSAKVYRLIYQGDSVYAIRNQISNIAEALVYFDSARHIAENLNNPLLEAYTYKSVGHVYNAWNKQPLTTVQYYKKAATLFEKMPDMQEQTLYVYYLLAHAYDYEKLGDSLQCIQCLQFIDSALAKLPDSLLNKLSFLPDYAWVSTNIHHYTLAQHFLDSYCQRANIANDSNSNNYLDHYYITKARIDVFGNNSNNSKYIDSLIIAAKQCNNRFDRQYYLLTLKHLYKKIGKNNLALQMLEWANSEEKKLLSTSITNLQERNDLLKKIKAANEEKINSYKKIRLLTNIVFFLLFGVLVAAILLMQVRWHKKRKQLLEDAERKLMFNKQLVEATEKERKRIAADLHDSVGNGLIHIRKMLAKENETLCNKIDNILEEVRTISRNLHPVMFDTVDFELSVNQLVVNTYLVHNFMLNVTCNYKNSLVKSKELQLYRIIQEAINNMIKHSNGVEGKIDITENDIDVITTIIDNGKGFDVVTVLKGKKAFGLFNIIERANIIGGKATIESTNSGTKIIITIPK